MDRRSSHAPGINTAFWVVLAIESSKAPMASSRVYVSTRASTDGCVIEMSYDLPERFSEEELPTGHRYKFKWRGDEIIGVDPRNPVTPFYPAMPC